MFLPDVTNSRSPTTLAPVVSPMSCLIEPRYSTLSEDTQSGPVWLAVASGAARRARAATAAAASDRCMLHATQTRLQPCGSVHPPNRRSASLAARRAGWRFAMHAVSSVKVLRPQHLARPQHDRLWPTARAVALWPTGGLETNAFQDTHVRARVRRRCGARRRRVGCGDDQPEGSCSDAQPAGG